MKVPPIPLFRISPYSVTIVELSSQRTIRKFRIALMYQPNAMEVDKSSGESEKSPTMKEATSVADIDDGKTVLYPGVTKRFPFKTSDRLLDDIKVDLSHILDKGLSDGLLKLPVLAYSKERATMNTWCIGYLLDPLVLQTNFEYNSVTCKEHNKVKVFMGVLFDPNFKMNSQDDLCRCSLYHIRVSTKIRTRLERTRTHFGVTQYYLVDKLHSYDEDDMDIYGDDDDDDAIIDSATFVSPHTNRVVRIEILKPEFSSEELLEFNSESIQLRYQNLCEKYPDLDVNSVPNQAECLNTLFKVFRNPLGRRDASDELKTIAADNKVLNAQLDPSWLVDKFGFELSEIETEDGKIIKEYKPPDFVNYLQDKKLRRLRDSYVRKSLELLFLGKQSASLLPKEVVASNSKIRSFQLYQTYFSDSFWHHLLHEHDRSDLNDHLHPYDNNYNFINITSNYHYADKDIIKNYETQVALDPQNTGIYYDALTFVANAKGSHQLLSYAFKQNVVGHDALKSAVSLFELDGATDPKSISEEVLLNLYREKSRNATPQARTDLKNAFRVLAKYKDSEKLKFCVELEPFQFETQAYKLLEIDKSVENDLIETAYSIKVSDAPGLKIECDRALYTLAVVKRSIPLFNLLFQKCPRFQQFYHMSYWSYSAALEALHVDYNASDELILEIFQSKWNQDPISSAEQFLNLKMALTKIGYERNSKVINHFLETGIVDPSYLPSGNWPAGINNIGNTCYLNSLLQYYFTISPLREYILNYNLLAVDLLAAVEKSRDMSERRIGGREVSKAEVERSVQFVYQLRNLFKDMVHTTERYVTPTRELAYLAFSPSNTEVEFDTIVQSDINESKDSLDARPLDIDTDLIDLSFDNDAVQVEADSVEVEADDIQVEADDIQVETDAVQDTSAATKRESSLSECELEPARPEHNEKNNTVHVAKINLEQLQNALEIGRQQDVTECIGNVLCQLESASVPLDYDEDNEQLDLIKQLFYGKLKQVLTPLDEPERKRTKYERFMSLLVNVGDHPKDIYDALDLYFQDDLLTLDEDKGSVKRSLTIEKLPTILQIQIQRVYYDREKFMPFKSLEPLPFSQKLYMDRYMATQDPELIRKKEHSAQLRAQLQLIKDQRRKLLAKNNDGQTLKSSMEETKRFLLSDVFQNVSQQTKTEKQNFLSQIDHFSATLETELQLLDNQAADIEHQITSNMENFKSIGYSLFAVFIHKGEASYGHYWVYLKDHINNGIWRKYNDESVTEVNENEVFYFAENNTATPYFLVYIKDSHKDEIEPLKRALFD
ncbi:HGL305Cp [Eremothecium sinecaudum]|uniref:Ubiquitin carboxyl-terminal hydrolase 2 n=1 Tax=Eremothecium sinecaudum TaxID=45286 RepID=A0A120K2M8_9SACH|nr:HGL305Cp [Eremothecium sinecaudum]AMD22035.1 HGL305Cp [Eremothecium sinecaudum]